MKILIADDEPRFLQGQRELLTLNGYQVDVACNGREAIERLDRLSYGLLILDIMMPDIDGFGVIEYIRDHDIDTTVIIVSGDDFLERAVDSLQLGAYDYLRKPFAAEELIKRIENAMRKRALERENREINRRLAHSEELYRFMVDSSPDVIYMLDEEGRFTFVNQRVSSLLGVRPKELEGRHFSSIVEEADRPNAFNAFNERRTGDRATRNLELRLVTGFRDSAQRAPRSVWVELNAMGMYDSEHGRFVGTYGVLRDVSGRKKAEETIRYQAYHDLLTGLPNRNLFNDHLSLAIAHARRTDQSLAVMFLDIDRFKLINDNFGHARGDDLLKSTGARLRNCLREGDTVARVGGDEFIILVSGVGAKRDVQKVASKIVKELRRPFSLEGREIFTSGSLGIALYPDDGDTMELLIKHADVAMYHMKDKGRDGFEFYDSEMNLRIANYLSLESSMRKGLEDGEFCLHYQPQVNMRSGGRVGVEALLRWNHPVRGLLLPSEFIPHAEESGLIVPIGQWVIEQVTEDIETWRKMGITPVKVAINLSALQFEQSNLVDEIITRFEGDESRQLEVEITENVIMKDVDDVVDKLVRLNRHGISVAVDDFGTGYSSLSYLHKLPIDTLKIDRAFVSDVGGAKHDSTIVRAIVAMAKGLGLNIIAEGVESRAQADYLLSQDCDIMQGYYFGAPMAADRTGQLFDPGRRLELA